jgi:hypothetical protein
MTEDNVKKIHENRIVITNNDAMLHANSESPQRQTFDKLQRLSSVSGKTQYWSYRIIKKIIDFVEDIEKTRITLIKQYCKKDEKNEPIMLGGEYQFDPDKKILYDQEIAAIKDPLPQEEIDKIAEAYCKRDKDDKPIKSKGNLFTFEPEKMNEFQTAFTEVMNTENTLPFDKVQIPSAVLEKMQANCQEEKDRLTIRDMIMLDKFFDFTE